MHTKYRLIKNFPFHANELQQVFIHSHELARHPLQLMAGTPESGPEISNPDGGIHQQPSLTFPVVSGWSAAGRSALQCALGLPRQPGNQDHAPLGIHQRRLEAQEPLRIRRGDG